MRRVRGNMGWLLWAVAAVGCGGEPEVRCEATCATADVCGLLPSRLGADYSDCVRSCELIDGPDRDRVFREFPEEALDAPDIEECANIERQLAKKSLGISDHVFLQVKLIEYTLYYELYPAANNDKVVELCGSAAECGDPRSCDPRACEKLGPDFSPSCEEYADIEIEIGLRRISSGESMIEASQCLDIDRIGAPSAYFSHELELELVRPFARYSGLNEDGDAFCLEQYGRLFTVSPGDGLVLVPLPKPSVLDYTKRTMGTCDP